MGFTPSALSQQLARLEREVGCALLERRATGAALTEAGLLLVRHGEAVAGEPRAPQQGVAPLRAPPPPHLPLGTLPPAGPPPLPPALAALRPAHPGHPAR